MRTLIIMALSFGAFFLQAQRPGGGRPNGNSKTIKGKIVEENTGVALEFATVSIFSLSDSTLVSGTITEVDGTFSLNIPNSEFSSFYGEVEFIGFENYPIEVFTFSKGKALKDLGTIALSAGGVQLDEIEVTAEKSELNFSLDKRVFNVGKDLGSRGGNASDILDNIPSVTVGVEGEVSLRGSENVRILINGRPSGLIGLGNTNGLRSIQAGMIERVEIITNPSSKFEAEGMAGIINIILKKDRARGFNGSFEVSGGSPLTYGAGANVNYRQDKLNWFLNYNYNKRTGPSNGSTYQEFYQGDQTAVSVQRSRRNRSGINNSIRFGSDYLLSDNEVITAAFLYRYSKDDNDNFVTYRDSLVDAATYVDRLTEEDFDTYLRRNDDEIERSPTLEYSLNYDKKFKGKNHSLKMDVSYQSNDEEESSQFSENIFQNDVLLESDVLEQRSANDEGQNQWRLQADYTRPVGDGGKMEAGALGTFRQIKNKYLVETLDEGVWIADPNLSNDFNYNEDVIGAYYNFGQEFTKWSYQLGIRSEYSRIKTELEQTNELNDRDYFNFFPSGFVNYKLGGNNTLQASYSRRIRRPRFWDLNPFFTFTDRRNFFSGNPNLDPEYTDSYEVGHLKYWDWGNIGTSIYYRYTTDLIQRIQIENPLDQTTVRRPENIGTEQNMGLEFIFAYTGTKWLRLDGSVNGFRFITEGISEEGRTLEVDNFAWTSRLNTRITFWNKTDLQLRLNYRAPRNTVQGTRKSITSLNVGLSKDVTKDLTITLSLRDAFNNRRRQSTIEQENLFQESDFQWRPRTFTATVNYRINKKKERSRRGGYQGGGDGEF